MARTTLAEIAERAGVTSTTVSLVFRNKPGVSTALRKKILKLGLEMNYISTSEIENKKKGVRIFQLGLIFISKNEPHLYGGTGHSYLFKILSGCLNKAEKLKCSLTILTLTYDDFKNDVLPSSLENNHLDGLIIRGYCNEEIQKKLFGLNLPLVFLDSTTNFDLYTQINVDNSIGVKLLLEHLHEKGVKKLATITGDLDFNCSQERLAFLQFYAWKFNMELKEENIIIEKDFDEESGRRATEQLIQNKSDFDALVCQNDLIAVGAYEVLKKNNYKVPSDVKIVGFDNMDLANTPVKMTSINCNGERLGDLAVSQLFNMILQKESYAPLKIKNIPTLVVGQTT